MLQRDVKAFASKDGDRGNGTIFTGEEAAVAARSFDSCCRDDGRGFEQTSTLRMVRVAECFKVTRVADPRGTPGSGLSSCASGELAQSA